MRAPCWSSGRAPPPWWCGCCVSFLFLLGGAVPYYDGSASSGDPRLVAVVPLGTATRRPQDHLGRQDPWFRSHGGAGNTFVESGRCKAAQLEEGLTNCGQSGADIAGSH